MFQGIFKDWARDQRAGVSVLFAMSLVVCLGAAGLAIDYSRSERLKNEVQLALDAAVLSGAVASPGEEIETASRRFASAGITGVSAAFTLTPAGEVNGQAQGVVRASLLQALGINRLHIAATSSAIREGKARVCVLVLDPVAPQALLVNGGAEVAAPDCEVHVRSSANPAAVFNAGTILDTKKLCVSGASVIDNGGAHAGLQTSCAAAADPYAGTLPDPPTAACDFTANNYNGGSVALTPGVYCGGINFNAAPDVTFAPGLYVIKGGNWNVNGGTWSGNGVVFYFADSSIIQFNSAVSATLTPPASGAYEGVAMFEAGGLAQSPFVLDDSKAFNIEGLLYLPSRNATFNSGSNLSDKKMTLVVNTLILDQTAWHLTPQDAAASAGSAMDTSRLTR